MTPRNPGRSRTTIRLQQLIVKKKAGPRFQFAAGEFIIGDSDFELYGGKKNRVPQEIGYPQPVVARRLVECNDQQNLPRIDAATGRQLDGFGAGLSVTLLVT